MFPVLVEADVDGDVAVQLAVRGPLAEQFHTVFVLFAGLPQAGQGEHRFEGVLILPMQLILDVGPQFVFPGEQAVSADGLHLPLHPDGVRHAVVQIQDVNAEILFAQSADQLLPADAAVFSFQSLLKDVVDVLGVHQHQLVVVSIAEVRYRWERRVKARKRSTSSGCSPPFRRKRSIQSHRGSSRSSAQRSFWPSRATS